MSAPFWEHLDEVAEQLNRASRLLLFSDYDGTLAPIVPRPEDAHMPPATRRLLAQLAGRAGHTVAVISGRSLDDVRRRVGLDGLIYAGNHGLDVAGPGLRFVEPTAAGLITRLAALGDDLARSLGHIPGILVEAKDLTLSVHYRSVEPSERAAVLGVLDTFLADDPDFLPRQGNLVTEIRPRVAWDKGTACLWIREHLEAADIPTIYLGDDLTDEDAFCALADAVTVHVGGAAPTLARYYIQGPDDVRRLLDWLAGQARGRISEYLTRSQTRPRA